MADLFRLFDDCMRCIACCLDLCEWALRRPPQTTTVTVDKGTVGMTRVNGEMERLLKPGNHVLESGEELVGTGRAAQDLLVLYDKMQSG